MNEALAVLAKYGVQTVNQLQPEQYGAFATELRALGAQV
jgi:anaerobic glycerol-3-phosphate dehydrogenase